MIVELDVIVVISTLEVVEFIPKLDVFVVMVGILISDGVITLVPPDVATVTPNGIVVDIDLLHTNAYYNVVSPIHM